MRIVKFALVLLIILCRGMAEKGNSALLAERKCRFDSCCLDHKLFQYIILLNFLFWWLSAMETPVPIPNTEVKRGSGDDTLQWGK
ncbi:MAG: hypothetical protein HW401_256 [Parcubacteria group bacterium]|nr:hypothetical protein [Parcubacteria group bacterium]